MFCRVCGAQVNDNAEICTSCGCNVLNGNSYCQECGAETTERQEICIKCGCRLVKVNKTPYLNTYKGFSAVDKAALLSSPSFLALDPYYQQEFSMIIDSNEQYKGKFNWCAFLFGVVWALSKGLWLSALVCVIISMATCGIGGVVYWFIYALRGNYMYYCKIIKKEQCVF